GGGVHPHACSCLMLRLCSVSHDKASCGRAMVFTGTTGVGPGETGAHGDAVSSVLSQSCFFESLGVCKSLNSWRPIFGFCAKIEFCDRTVERPLEHASTGQGRQQGLGMVFHTTP